MMPNQERVLHGLNSCGFYDGIPNICEVTECPYRDDKCGCVHELAHDAGLLISELLKAQEPRVLTLEELSKLQEDDVAYVEIKPIPDMTCISVELIRFVEEVQDPATWIELHTTDSVGFFETRKSTEPNWRCWTSRPTQEQMEATPWN